MDAEESGLEERTYDETLDATFSIS